jgi:peptidoglycan/LPS O-acetylase OafA/YrhL
VIQNADLLDQSVVNGGPPRRPERQRLDSLTGLRAIAALCVFVHHTMLAGDNVVSDAYRRIGMQGAMGVTFFFVLSGFVLTWSMGPLDTKRAFWRRRFARVYPAYLVALIAAAALYPTFQRDVELGPLVTNLLQVQSWVPDIQYFFGLNSVSWSLSCEAFFYLCFPFLAPALMRCSQKQLRLTQIGLIGLILVATVASQFIADEDTRFWFGGYFPPVRFLEFALGCTAAVDFMRGTRVPLSFRTVGLVAVGAYLVAGFPAVQTYSLVVIPIIPIVLVLMASAQRDVEGAPSFLRNRILVWGGEISFCFYLVHQLVIRYFSIELPKALDASPFTISVVNALVSLPVTIACATALHYLVEKPCERRLRGGSQV